VLSPFALAALGSPLGVELVAGCASPLLAVESAAGAGETMAAAAEFCAGDGSLTAADAVSCGGLGPPLMSAARLITNSTSKPSAAAARINFGR
jgi:hypothetical protein